MKTTTKLVAIALACAGWTISGCSSSSSPSPPKGDGGTTAAWRAAVGSGGLLAETFDDAAWSSRSIGARTLRSVTCSGNLAGWVAGSGGFVAHSIDGGASWSTQDAHTSADLYGIRFGTLQLGALVGDRGTLAVTKDGGASWTAIDAGVSVALRGVTIAPNAGVILAVGDHGTIARSEDYGAHWQASAIAGAGDLSAVAADLAAHTIVAVDSAGIVWSSADRGATFVRAADAGAPLHAIAATDDGARFFATGDRGVAMIGASGGWTLASAGAANLHAALVTEDGFFYAAGEGGALVKSDDKGAHWRSIDLGTNETIYALEDL